MTNQQVFIQSYVYKVIRHFILAAGGSGFPLCAREKLDVFQKPLLDFGLTFLI